MPKSEHFPTTFYHPVKGAQEFQTQEEMDEVCGNDEQWVDNPDKCGQKVVAPEPEPVIEPEEPPEVPDGVNVNNVKSLVKHIKDTYDRIPAGKTKAELWYEIKELQATRNGINDEPPEPEDETEEETE